MMSERERWFIYPILFFLVIWAGCNEWDRNNGTTKFNQVVCDGLVVQGLDGKTAVALKSDEGGGLMYLVRQHDRVALVVGHEVESRITGLMLANESGRVLPVKVLNEEIDALQLIPWPENDLPEP